MGIIALPWSFKIFYGFCSDNVKIFGSKRRGHILLNTVCCSLSMIAVMLFGLRLGKYFVTACVFISQLTMAYNDTVTDALTVQASKFGAPDGSENLNSLCYMMQGFGAISGALMAALVQTTPSIGPFDCFGIYLALQTTFFVCALFMNKKMEPGEITDLKQEEPQPLELGAGADDQERLLSGPEQQRPVRARKSRSCCQKLFLNLKLIWIAGMHAPIYCTLGFFIIRGALVPTLDNAQYYFLLEKCGIAQDQYDFLNLGQSVGIIIGTIIYVTFLTKF